MTLIDDYQKRLQNLPQIDKFLEKEIRQLQLLVNEQQTQKQLNDIAIQGLKTQLSKTANKVDQKDNQIQGLTQSEQKTIAKQKKYINQIQTLNKKIQQNKQETQTRLKQIQNFKKDIRTLEGQVSMMNAEKSKVLQGLMKKQIKFNNLVQTVTALKLKKLEPVTKVDAPKAEDNKKEEKQIVELFGSLKKQMELIDVLKRQKTHLIASTVFKYCEADFEKLLEMNNKV